MLVAVALLAGTVAIAAGPSGAAARWSVVPSPSPPGPPDGSLAGVSCASPTSCFAVGSNSGEGGTVTGDGVLGNGNPPGVLIERWDGASWSIVTAPIPKGATDVEVNGVSCPSPTSCFAVGDSAVDTRARFSINSLIEHWDGTSWSIVASPNPAGADTVTLDAVSCSSPTSCFAVGDTSAESAASFSVKTLIERWDGVSWSIVASPTPSGAIETSLLGASCPSASSCFAVGSYVGHATVGGFVERWDGTAWSIVVGPPPFGPIPPGGNPQPPTIPNFTTAISLSGVSCVSDSSCFAVGQGRAGTFAARWEGTSWSVVSTPNPVGASTTSGAELTAVSCASATDCSAVGGSFVLSSETEATDPLSEHWDGAAWSIVPQPSRGPVHELRGVSCPIIASCAAVGDSALPEQLNGTSWAIAPFATATSQSQLQHVACPSPTSCFAVGAYGSNTRGNTLVEHWDGTRWSILASPNPSGSVDAALTGVSCPTTTSCTAVGSSDDGSRQRSLIEHWNGTRWSIVPSPDPKGADVADLRGVSCASATNCNAVGITLGKTFEGQTLAEHWNGTRWSIVPSFSPKHSVIAQLIDVSCPSSTACYAVGSYVSISGRAIVGKSLLERWNGTSWSLTPDARPGDAHVPFLVGVSCPSTTNCMAVGFDSNPIGTTTSTLTEHWNGTSWSVVASPQPPRAIQAALLGVSCRSATNCYAVGGSASISSDQALVEHWNGKSWAIAASAVVPGATATALGGVACPSAASCTAVGSYRANDGAFTLAERGA